MAAKEKKFQLMGWALFVVSAMFFIASSIRSGDWVGLVGSLLFFLACILFLAPFLTAKPLADDGRPPPPPPGPN